MPPLAAVPDLERELDALYAMPLDAFTKARNDLAARLKKAHQEEAAAAVRALRKPSVVAGAANALARSEPKLVASLLQAGDHLRDVQQPLNATAEVDERAEVPHRRDTSGECGPRDDGAADFVCLRALLMFEQRPPGHDQIPAVLFVLCDAERVDLADVLFAKRTALAPLFRDGEAGASND